MYPIRVALLGALLLAVACRQEGPSEATSRPTGAATAAATAGPLSAGSGPAAATAGATATAPLQVAAASATPAAPQAATPSPVSGGSTPTTARSATPPAAGPAAFNPATTTIRLEPVASGLRSPVGLAHAGDRSGRLFVVEKAGTIRVVRQGVVVEEPFLDITPIVGARGSEQGLLGLAFHPDYSRNGLFFVNYTGQDGNTIVARYQVSPDANRADPGTGSVILRVDQPYANHNGGHLAFGPDGYLYIGLGDGGSGGDPRGYGQNPAALLGKMLRIDVDAAAPYGIPGDNPFREREGYRREIWALGLRNPWRYSFDRATGDLYIADVGQNAYEEVSFQPASSRGGENYGWNHMEGAHCFRASPQCDPTAFTLPVAEYGRGGGCSITGGYVYRGASQPALRGAYFFADYCSGKFWALHRESGGAWVTTELIDTDVSVSSFGEDEAGEVYVVGLGDGRLYRLVANGA